MTGWRAFFSELGGFLLDGARAAVFLPRRDLRIPLTAITIPVLILLNVAALVVLGRAAESGPVTFEPAGVEGVLLQAGALVFSSALLAAIPPARRLSTVYTFALSVSLVIDVAWNGLWLWHATGIWFHQHVPRSFAVWDVSQVWLGLAIAFALLRASVGPARKVLVFVFAAIVVSGPALSIDRSPAVFWIDASNSADAQASLGLASEELLYGENGRLDNALDSLTPRTPGRINVYFVGFAGSGSQAVFMREVIYVKALFEKRFDAIGHSIALINNPATAQSVPLATITSLHDSIAEIGKRMTDDDILVVFLTSHGSAEAGVNVSLVPFEFDDLDPQTLKDMLDDAHIRQRVVIVSACYSGIFVKPLTDPNTLVITAADTTHTSFGCSNEADFTYFGEAYFAHGLAQTTSFTDAFQIAEPIIEKREDAAGYVHSHPQMAVGAAIKTSLAQLERQLKRAPP